MTFRKRRIVEIDSRIARPSSRNKQQPDPRAAGSGPKPPEHQRVAFNPALLLQVRPNRQEFFLNCFNHMIL